MNEKQQQLTFDKGITNVPSDALCSDNALEESVGMIYDNGEHRVIQKPEVFIDTAVYTSIVASGIPTILYIHKFNNEERYIGYITGGTIVWGTKSDTTFTQIGTFGSLTYSGGMQVTSIGKTLIMADSNGLRYYIWSYDKENGNNPVYTHIGDSLPVPVVDFQLHNINEASNEVTSEKAFGSDWLVERDGTYISVNPLHQEDWNNLIVGLHSKNKYDIHQKKRFWGTFAIRVALKMYDGTYSMVSNPIIMFNQFQIPCIARLNDLTAKMGIKGQELKYKKINDLSAWKDLVSEIVIFVSRESRLFDTDSNAVCEYYEESGTYAYGACISGNIKEPVQSAVGSNNIYKVLNNIEDEGVRELAENGLFYKLCSIGLEQSTDWESVDGQITTNTLENITTQEQLPEDDYFGHSEYIPSFIYAYNSRLNMANVSRSVFSGFSYFLPYDNYHRDGGTVVFDENNYDIYVKIATDSGERVVKNSFSTSQKQGIWFYYPDDRALHVTIYKGNDCILDEELKEHPSLHGAYYFHGNLTTGDDEPSVIVPTPSTALDDDDVDMSPELLPNYIIQSEVNNPFVFKAEGYFKVGTGMIIGMSTITQALSEGQFGQYPLLVFSESGIWSLSVASTGYYDSVRPMSREVALLNNPCITQTDGAVFFASKKGLMVVVGNQVKCVSEQLSGKDGAFSDVTNLGNFAGFLETAIIAYDYRDSLLWIFDKTHTTCYIYSIKSGTFGKYEFGTGNAITNVVNYYPDYLIQNSSGIYSLLARPNINADEDTYSGTIITRPMKLESALALKSIMQVRHITDMEGSIALKIYASNNLKGDWVQLTSLRGRPWKYYRFRYDFTNMAATDRFAGTMLITQERRTDKLR